MMESLETLREPDCAIYDRKLINESDKMMNPMKRKGYEKMQMRKIAIQILVLLMLLTLTQSSFAENRKTLLTPPEIWKDFKPDEGDFKEEIVRQETRDGIYYRESYISAYVLGEEIRVYCKYSVKAGAKNAPGLMNVHGWMGAPNIDNQYVNDGWAVMAHDYCGTGRTRPHYTKYPKTLNRGNMNAPVNAHVTGGVSITDHTQTSDYIWYAIQRRVLSYLLAQKEVDKNRIGAKGYSYGGTIMWNLGMDPRVKAIVAYFGVGWLEYYRTNGVWMYNNPYREPEKTTGQEIYLAGIAPQAHAPYITAASLWLNGTNDHHGGHERGEQIFKMFKQGTPWAFALQARGHHNTEKTGQNCKLWLEKYVLGKDITWPGRPKSEIKLDAEGVPELHVIPDSPEKVKEIEMYYALKNPVSFARAWRDAETVRQGNTWVAKMPVLNVDDYVFGFANIKYDSTIVVSSDFNAAIPSRLGQAVATDKPSNIISEGTGMWTEVAPVEGVGGIKGFRALNRHRGTVNEQFSDPKWKAPHNAQLSFKFYCTQPQTLTMIVNNGYQADIEMTASDDWQTMVVPADTLINIHNKQPMGDWSHAASVRIKPKAGMDITKVVFADFKWLLVKEGAQTEKSQQSLPGQKVDKQSNGPLAWWKFDERGQTEFIDGKSGQALFFGGGVSYLDIGNLGLFKSMTMTLWLRPESHFRPYNAIMSCCGWAGTSPHLLLLNNGHIRFSVKDAKPIDIDSKTSLAGNLGQWVHLAVVVDGERGTFRFYVNGKLDLQRPIVLPAPLNMKDVWLGGWDGGVRFLHGAIDDVQIYSKAVSAETIAAIASGEEPKNDIVARWKMDGDTTDALGRHNARLESDPTFGGRLDSVYESIGGVSDRLEGYHEFAEGVRGGGLKCDGFTTHVVRKSDQLPPLAESFSFEAWVAPQVYPWNWAAIVNQEREQKEGWFFGVSGEGRIGLRVAIDGKWNECISKSQLPLLKWSHVMGTFDAREGLKVYINGKLEGVHHVTGMVTPARDVDVWLGQSHTKNYPIRTERRYSATFLSPMVFDGLIDEIKIYGKSLTEEDVANAYAAVQLKVSQPLKWRVLPSGPDGPAPFGAVYTRLKYAPEWERLWRIGDYADILVRFDESPVKVVFWRGMNYAASYVSENGLWSGDQSLECNSAETGCYEHMSDKQCQFTHARIIENHDARVVVHWRYAMVGIDLKCLRVDPATGWGNWVDEYFTIYPDGVTVRNPVIQEVRGGHQWQETILFNQPGARPEDMVEIEAFSIANMDGESHTYSWENGPPQAYEEPAGANIQMTNFRSQYKPYVIFEPGSRIGPFRIPPSSDYSKFPCWNHWPVAQLPNDGRKAIASDRPSSFSLSCGYPVKHSGPNNSQAAAFLYGMTDRFVTDLVPLAKSWISPPKLIVKGSGFNNQGYDRFQRAYVVECGDNAGTLEFTLEASEDSPIVNPAFVIKNWDGRDVTLKINGKKIKRGKTFRYGFRPTLDGQDLIVWIKHSDSSPVRIVIK